MSIRTNYRKTGKTYTAVIRKGQYRSKPLKRTFPTKGEAIYWKAEQKRLIDMKKHRDPRLSDHVPLSVALNKYAEHGKNVLKKTPSTLDREIYSCNHIERLIGALTPLSEINTAVIAHYQTERISEEASASSIRQELALLSRMFRVARTSWMLPVDNPVEGVDRIRPDRGRERFLTDDEVALVIAETKNARNKKFWFFRIKRTFAFEALFY